MSKVKNQEKVIVQNLEKNKGQALVEFVIIVPIIIMFIFIIIDFSNIFYQKNHLESIVNDIANYKENGRSNSYIAKKVAEDINITYQENGSDLTIKVNKNINLITPFSGLFFQDPFPISTERTIIYE